MSLTIGLPPLANEDCWLSGDGAYMVVMTDKVAPDVDLKEEVMDTLLSYLEVRMAMHPSLLSRPASCKRLGLY
jgi:hypothetical protein